MIPDGVNELKQIEHEFVVDSLETLVSQYIQSEFLEDDTITVTDREDVDVPYSKSRSRASVLVDFNDTNSIPDSSWRSKLRGGAFVVRTRSEEKIDIARKLKNFDKAGYQPILVTPGWVLIEERGVAPPYEWMLKLCHNGCALEIVSADPIRFTKSAIEHTTLVLPEFREYLMRNQPCDVQS
jgi:hypothetical protein